MPVTAAVSIRCDGAVEAISLCAPRTFQRVRDVPGRHELLLLRSVCLPVSPGWMDDLLKRIHPAAIVVSCGLQATAVRLRIEDSVADW